MKPDDCFQNSFLLLRIFKVLHDYSYVQLQPITLFSYVKNEIEYRDCAKFYFSASKDFDKLNQKVPFPEPLKYHIQSFMNQYYVHGAKPLSTQIYDVKLQKAEMSAAWCTYSNQLKNYNPEA